MKCPKCNYSSFDYLDECKRCGTDLRDVRTSLQIIAVSPEERAPAAAATAADRTAAEDSLVAAEVADRTEERPQEALFEEMDFDGSFDDLVEPTSHEGQRAAAEEGGEEELLDLDFGELFGEKEKEDA